MSLNSKKQLREIAKIICRDLRKNQTNAERIFWELVRDRKFQNFKFLRQHPIFYDITGKESFFVADFFCFKKKLVIELDGLIHKFRLKEYTSKNEILNYLGLRVIRFTNEQIEKDVKGVLNYLSDYIKYNSPSVALLGREGNI